MRKAINSCPVCGSREIKDLDYLRDFQYWYVRDYLEDGDKIGFSLCQKCGFLFHYGIVDEKKHYENERKVINHDNVVLNNRRNEFQKAFLDDYLKEMPMATRFLDIGCGTGGFLHLLQKYGFSNLWGTELNTKAAKFARGEYGLNITEKIDGSLQYDFISLYRVLEHISNPVEYLKAIMPLLSDKGYVYISVPIYLERLEDEMSDSVCGSFENLYHVNHVNCFTVVSLRNVLSLAGLEVELGNWSYHGYTVLCRRKQVDEKQIKQHIKIENEDAKVIEDKLNRQKQAIELFNKRDFDGAIEIYPQFPDAHVYGCMTQQNMKDINIISQRLDAALKLMPLSHKIINQYAKSLFQWDENTPANFGFYSNNVKKSEKLFLQCIDLRPGMEDAYYFLGAIEAKYKKNVPKGVEYMKKFAEINPTKWNEAYMMIGHFWSNS